MSTGTAVTLGTRPHGPLSYAEARESPCLTCHSSPCCTYLMLRKLELASLLDVDYAVYLANFDGILLGLDPDGTIRVYLYQPCGHLDVPTGLCTVHSTPAQPAICVHYNAHSCKYRNIMTEDVHEEQVLMDSQRVGWLASHMAFDDDRRVVGMPDWRDVLGAFETMALARTPAPPPPPDPVRTRWQAIALSAAPPESHAERYRFAEAKVSDPCNGCAAWCCSTLVFSRDVPKTANELDYFKYCIGFPSVELAISDDGWAIVVRTTCGHLDDGRCQVFGLESRPLRCGYYDALKCTYRVHFGTPQPREMVRVSQDQFAVLADVVDFDDLGRVRALPSTDALRILLERDMQAAVPT